MLSPREAADGRAQHEDEMTQRRRAYGDALAASVERSRILTARKAELGRAAARIFLREPSGPDSSLQADLLAAEARLQQADRELRHATLAVSVLRQGVAP